MDGLVVRAPGTGGAVTTREDVFSESERRAQQRWGDPDLWTETRIATLVWNHIPERFHARIEAAPFFFLATSDHDCAFKGGGPGLVRMLAPDRLTFPHFRARVPGNGAYSSLGNILVNDQVSLLFVDFNDGGRLRVNGRATVHDDAERRALFPHAECVVAVQVDRVMPSCPSYVPRLVLADPP
jgi:predicted pyridoxine 5'-phosphate oxidase superfamily flavin-nucleotide-binding protein